MSIQVLERKKTTSLFVPELVYFEPDALEYEKGKRIHEWALSQGTFPSA